jgi:hypothetical protein
VQGELEEGKTGPCVDAGAHASEPASRPSHWHFIHVRFHFLSRVGILFACVFRGSSPSQLMNRQSPRYAIIA